MKREHRLRYIIKEGILDTFFIWKDELKNVFKDSGVMIFFFLVPFIYPLLYALSIIMRWFTMPRWWWWTSRILI